MIPSTFLGKTVEEHEEKTEGHSMDRIPQKQSHGARPPCTGAGRTRSTKSTPLGWSFPVAQVGKNLPAVQKTQVPSLGLDPLEKGMATHSSILACRIPWTEEPGGLQLMRLQRVRRD